MATVIQRRTKDGKVRYLIQAVITEYDGTRTTKATTWPNADNLTGVRAKNAAIAFGVEWEKKLKNFELEQTEIRPRRFSDIAAEWAAVKESSKSHSYGKNIRNIIGHLNKSFGDKYMKQLRAEDVYAHFAKLNNATYGMPKARVKPEKFDAFHDAILKYGNRKLQTDIACKIINNSWKGSNMHMQTAKMFCVRLGLNIKEYFDTVNDERPYCKVTINRHRKILYAIFNYAISLGQAHSNYASPAFLKDKIGGAPSKETKILTDAEMERFEALLDTKPLFDTIPFYVMMYTGCRRAEACGLHWDDVDWDNHIIHIKRDRVFESTRGTYERETKNKYSVRKVPLVPKLYEKLLKHKETVEYWIKKGECKHILCHADGTPKAPLNIGRVFQKFLVEANCTIMTLHKLRHWFITFMITANAPVNTVSKLVGHADNTTVLKVYLHNKMTDSETHELMENIFSKNKGEKNEN